MKLTLPLADTAVEPEVSANDAYLFEFPLSPLSLEGVERLPPRPKGSLHPAVRLSSGAPGLHGGASQPHRQVWPPPPTGVSRVHSEIRMEGIS